MVVIPTSPTPFPVDVINVHRDAFDIIATVLSILTIVIAVAAYIKAVNEGTQSRNAGTAERTRVFELGILMDLADILDNSVLPEVMGEPSRTRLDLLPGALPVWELVRDAPRQPDEEIAALTPVFDSLGISGPSSIFGGTIQRGQPARGKPSDRICSGNQGAGKGPCVGVLEVTFQPSPISVES